MAEAAGYAQPPVVAGAGLTSKGCVFEVLRTMAFLAGDAGVEADEGEARDVVVEVDLLAPAGFFVALLAFGAELAFVGIGLGVTARARDR